MPAHEEVAPAMRPIPKPRKYLLKPTATVSVGPAYSVNSTTAIKLPYAFNPVIVPLLPPPKMHRQYPLLRSDSSPNVNVVNAPNIEPIVISNTIAPPIIINTLDEPDDKANDYTPVPVPQEPETVTEEPDRPSVPALDSPDSCAQYKEFVLPYCDRHKRPLAIERVVLIAPTIASDHSQGKGSRYKAINCHQQYNFSPQTAVSNVVSIQSRAELLKAAPNDNSKGKSSRYKRLAIEQDMSPPSLLSVTLSLSGKAIECVLPSSFSVSSFPITNWYARRTVKYICHFLSQPLRRLKNTMTTPVSTGIQAFCFLPIDPLHQQQTPLPPSFV